MFINGAPQSRSCRCGLNNCLKVFQLIFVIYDLLVSFHEEGCEEETEVTDYIWPLGFVVSPWHLGLLQKRCKESTLGSGRLGGPDDLLLTEGTWHTCYVCSMVYWTEFALQMHIRDVDKKIFETMSKRCKWPYIHAHCIRTCFYVQYSSPYCLLLWFDFPESTDWSFLCLHSLSLGSQSWEPLRKTFWGFLKARRWDCHRPGVG